MKLVCAMDLSGCAASVPLQDVHYPVFEAAGIRVRVRRDDLVHPSASGNKFYKLFHNIKAAKAAEQKTLLSFGGAWSNHLHALAQVARDQGLNSVAVVRGERPTKLSAMLIDAESQGMQLHFVSRQQYRDKLALQADLEDRFGPFYEIPEGGANELGAKGCVAIGHALKSSGANTIFVPSATGGTAAGIAAGLPDGMAVTAVNVLKGAGDLRATIDSFTRALGNQRDNWCLLDGFHCGGYAKFPEYLRAFMMGFEQCAGLRTDPIYGVKVWWALAELIKQAEFPRGHEIVVVHTGGLQGRRGFSGLGENTGGLGAMNE